MYVHIHFSANPHHSLCSLIEHGITHFALSLPVFPEESPDRLPPHRKKENPYDANVLPSYRHLIQNNRERRKLHIANGYDIYQKENKSEKVTGNLPDKSKQEKDWKPDRMSLPEYLKKVPPAAGRSAYLHIQYRLQTASEVVETDVVAGC